MPNVITGTQWWVWVILCYVIFIGIKSTRDRVVYLPKLFIMPAIFLGLKYQIFDSGNGMLLLIYFLFMLLGFIPPFFLGLKAKVQIIKSTNSVKLPGNYSMICFLFSYFCIKFALGFLQAMAEYDAILNGKITDLGLYLMLDIAITALFSGYLLGKATSYAWRMFIWKRS